MAGKFYIDAQGNITANRPMTLQENYGGLRGVPRQIEYTGDGRPVGSPSGISRPGVAVGQASATQTPPTGRNLPALRSSSVPTLRPAAEPPMGGLRSTGFTLGPEGSTVSPVRPSRATPQLGHAPAQQIGYDAPENIDAEVRARAARFNKPFVEPAPVSSAIPKTTMFGGRGGAQPVLVGGGIAGEVYRKWSRSSGRTIPIIDKMFGSGGQAPFSSNELHRLGRGNAQPQAPAPTPSFADSAVMNSQRGSLADMLNMNRTGAPTAPPSTPSTPSQSARFKGGAPRRVLQPRAVSAPSATPSSDSHGYAIVGGKRINYQDIGTKRDPLARNDGMVSTPEGGTMLLGNPTAYRPIPQEERSARGIADLTPQETLVRNNERIQSDLATITANMGNQYDGEQQIAAAKTRIAALQNQNDLLQKGIAGDQSLEGQKYVADMGLRGHQTNIEGQKYAADMGLKGHQIDRESNIDVARLYSDAQIRSASLGRKNRDNAQAAAEDKARLGVRNQVINSYDWTGINPTTANKYATIMAQTFDKPGYETFSDPQSRYNDVVLHPEIAKNFGPTLRAARNSDEYAAILAEITRLTNGQGVHHTGIANTRRLPRLKRAADAGLSGLNIQ